MCTFQLKSTTAWSRFSQRVSKYQADSTRLEMRWYLLSWGGLGSSKSHINLSRLTSNKYSSSTLKASFHLRMASLILVMRFWLYNNVFRTTSDLRKRPKWDSFAPLHTFVSTSTLQDILEVFQGSIEGNNNAYFQARGKFIGHRSRSTNRATILNKCWLPYCSP